MTILANLSTLASRQYQLLLEVVAELVTVAGFGFTGCDSTRDC